MTENMRYLTKEPYPLTHSNYIYIQKLSSQCHSVDFKYSTIMVHSPVLNLLWIIWGISNRYSWDTKIKISNG